MRASRATTQPARSLRRRYAALLSVMDPKTLNLDPDPEFWPNLDPDPSSRVMFQLRIKLKII